MDQQVLWSIESILQLLVLGAVLGAPVLAISIRLALKPLLKTYLQAQKLPDAEHVTRQLQVMEVEIRGLQQSLQAVLDAEDFRRQLSTRLPGQIQQANGNEPLPHSTPALLP